MTQTRDGRHLAAIMFVDMVGYSARMQRSEPRTIEAVQNLWTMVRPILVEHGGREVDLAGDGMLMEFPGVLAAVNCATRVHAELHTRNKGVPADDRVRVRAGLHLGDIEHRDGRVFGDGVNIAARVLGLSPPGAIAMTPHVRDQLLNVLDTPPQRLGVRRLKNIREPLEIWCLPGPDCTSRELAEARRDEGEHRRWTFGNAVFDERTLELMVDGQPATLEKKPLEVLAFLLRHAGEVVTKDEILDAVWSGRILSDTVLAKCVSRLREELKDEAQETIRTVHGFGYRLACPVKVDAVAPEAAPRFDFQPGDRPPLRPQWGLVERLGGGGHGEAWLARHDKTRDERVFKFALEAGALDSLKREITLYRVLHNSLGDTAGVARVLDWNLEQPPYFIESEYIAGGNLAQWLEAQGGVAVVPHTTRLELVAQVAEALAAAHSVGVLHKDLKPANILIEEAPAGPRVRLCDFGSGGVLDPQLLQELGITRMGFTKTILDATDTTSGTPFYLAPEVVAGQPFTVQSDVYALGVVLYQLVVGDLRRALAPGWEADVHDELLREDIAAAASGNPGRRLADAGGLAHRLRTLDERRLKRERDRDARLKAEKAEQMRSQVRRLRVIAAGLVLFAGGLAAAGAYAYKARNDALKSAETTRAVSHFLANDVLQMSDPWKGRLKDITVRDLIDRSASIVGERLTGQPEAEGEVRMALSGAYGWLGQRESSLEQATIASAKFEEVFGRQDRRTLDALQIVAGKHAASARRVSMDEALALLEEVEERLKAQVDPDDDALLSVASERAWAYHHIGLYREARDTLLAALKARYPDGEPYYGESVEYQFALCEILRASGDFARAEETCRRAVENSARQNGENHYFTAWNRFRYGNLLRTLGRTEEAEGMFRRAAQDLENWLGPNHHQALNPVVALGALHVDRGRFREATQIFDAALSRCIAGRCEDPEKKISPLLRARAYLGEGRFAEAERLVRQELADDEEKGYNSGYYELVNERALLAEIQLRKGDLAGARATLQQIGPLGRSLREGHPDVLAELRRVQGLVAHASGDTGAARKALQEALDLTAIRLGRDHWRTQRARNELAGVERS